MPTVHEQLDRLAAYQTTGLPVISLYLNTEPDQHGRDNIDAFLRRELPARGRTFPAHSEERESFDADVLRITTYVADELKASSNGLAIFACSADDLFEAVQLDAPVRENRLYVYHRPHLYELARITDAYPRYAAVVLDSNLARIFVFALGALEGQAEVENAKLNRSQAGGWSQARYQRHIDQMRQQHAKEVAERLDRIVREENVTQVFIAGDEVIVPVLQAELSQQVTEKLGDPLRLDITTPEHEVLRATLESLREQDAQTDEERVRRALDAYRAGGLGAAGIADTLVALVRGQVGELLIAGDFDATHAEPVPITSPLVPEELAALLRADDVERVDLADELVSRAQATGADVTIIENAELLADVEGVAAALRFRV